MTFVLLHIHLQISVIHLIMHQDYIYILLFLFHFKDLIAIIYTKIYSGISCNVVLKVYYVAYQKFSIVNSKYIGI